MNISQWHERSLDAIGNGAKLLLIVFGGPLLLLIFLLSFLSETEADQNPSESNKQQ